MGNGQAFVNRIDEVLKEKNLKRQALTDACGFSVQALTDWKRRDSIPAADIALKIADYLQVSVEWLIDGRAKENEDNKDVMNEILQANKHLNRAVEILNR